MQVATIGLDIAKNVFQVHGTRLARCVIHPLSVDKYVMLGV
jgi:hypothetical protein